MSRAPAKVGLLISRHVPESLSAQVMCTATLGADFDDREPVTGQELIQEPQKRFLRKLGGHVQRLKRAEQVEAVGHLLHPAFKE